MLKLALLIWEKSKKTPQQDISKLLAEFDSVVSEAKKTKDLKKVAEFLGRGL
jgi:hypothetical protein